MSEAPLVERGSWATDEIPSGWCWADFDRVFVNVTSSDRKVKQEDYAESGAYPVIDQGEEPIGGYTDDASLLQPESPPFIVFGDHTRCVKYVTQPFVQGADGVKVLKIAGLEPQYALWALRTLRLPNKGYSRHYQFLRNSRFPIAPLPEQRRIVAKIEELFSDLDAGVAALERVRANLKRYRAAVLKAAVEGSPNSPPSWKPIGEVIYDLEQGWSPKCESVPATKEDEWAVMTTTAIQPLRFSSSENKRLPKSLAPRTDLEVRAGDMMITRAGPRSRAGVACLVRATRKRLILCDKAYRFQCDEKQMRGAFLEIALNADPVLRNLEKMKTGISDSGVNLTQPRFRELMVPVPTLAAQDRIVAEVDRRLSVADAAEQQVEHALQRAARLRQAILKRAFEGKLVPQDPTDEPATTLLERLKAGSNGHGGTIIRNRGAGADKPANRGSRAHA